MKDYDLKAVLDYCNDDIEVKKLIVVFRMALLKFQWQYQEAEDRQARDIKKQIERAKAILIEHCRRQGQEGTVSYIESIGYDDMLIPSNVLTQVKRYLKEHTVKYCDISEKRYNKDFAKLLIEHFKDYCELHPLDKAPASIDTFFQPY